MLFFVFFHVSNYNYCTLFYDYFMRNFIYNIIVLPFEQWWWLLKKNAEFRKDFLLFLFILLLIDAFALIFIFIWFENSNLIELKQFLVWLVLFVTVVLFIGNLNEYVSCYSDGARIDKNMDSLPKDIWWHKVIVQYNAPKKLNPSEIWFLYYLLSDKELTKAILYKWEAEWIIEISKDRNENWSYMIKKIWELKMHNVPSYEMNLWFKAFSDIDDESHDMNLLLDSSENIQKEIENYCFNQWWIELSKNRSDKYEYYLFFVFVFCFLIQFLSKILMIVFLFVFMVYFIYNLLYEPDYERTDEWNKLYAHIMWYKYYLERCEEKQLLSLLKSGKHHDNKLLSTMIALRMDWKFLEKAYFEDDDSENNK